jgi:hypothetical protein
MILLYDFDKEISYLDPDETFFRDLKDVKWDKNAKKVYDSIKDIYDNSIIASTGRILFMSFNITSDHVLPFLGACNAVKNRRKAIEIEDVLVAFETYFKFCDFKPITDEIDKSDKIELLDETAIPEPIDKFLHRTGLKVSEVVNLSPDYKNVVHVNEKFRGIIKLNFSIYMALFDEVFDIIIEDFGMIAYTKHNYHDFIYDLENKRSVFTIFFTKKLLEEDLPHLIKKDYLDTRQTNTAMIYNIENNTLYGRNVIHMKEFKKIIGEWGNIENCENNDYFKVKII